MQTHFLVLMLHKETRSCTLHLCQGRIDSHAYVSYTDVGVDNLKTTCNSRSKQFTSNFSQEVTWKHPVTEIEEILK